MLCLIYIANSASESKLGSENANCFHFQIQDIITEVFSQSIDGIHPHLNPYRLQGLSINAVHDQK